MKKYFKTSNSYIQLQKKEQTYQHGSENVPQQAYLCNALVVLPCNHLIVFLTLKNVLK